MLSHICHSNDVPEGKCKSFSVNDIEIFALRKNGELCAFVNYCPHLGVPLNWQPDKFLDAEEELIQCASHGALFLPTSGECVAGPCLGRSLRRFTIIEHAGEIWSDASEDVG